jgi:MoaA/NifB/PqqE/SkfB family radical SAM enzyme
MDISRPAPPEALLSLEEIERLAGTLGRGLYNVNLTGGEPFLRDDLFDILSAYVRRSTVRSIVITTNGTLTDAVRRFVDRFRTLDFTGRVTLSVSIDHLEERHDELRRVPGAFRQALETYALVDGSRDRRLMADIALTVTPFNHREVQDIHHSLLQRGVKNVTAVLMREEGAALLGDHRQEVRQAYLALARSIDADCPDQTRVSAGHRLSEALRRGKNRIVAGMLEGREAAASRISCRAGSLFGVVGPTGDVHPCEMLGPSWRMGSLRDRGMDFLRLWQGQRADDVRKRLAALRCSCTYECALSVTILTDRVLLARLLARSRRRSRYA